MARIKESAEVKVGTVGNLSYYKRKDMEGLIVRTKGGPTKKMIKYSPTYAVMRQRNVEFGVCSKMSAQIRRELHRLKLLSDYNVAAMLNSLASRMTKTDLVNPIGQRSLCLSKNKEMLKGFTFNKIHNLDFYYGGLYTTEMDRKAFTVKVNFPAILPSVHIMNAPTSTHFRWIVQVGVVEDFEYNPERNEYNPLTGRKEPDLNISIVTPWIWLMQDQKPMVLDYAKKLINPLRADETVLIGLGIEFGQSITDTVIDVVKNSGAAKIIGVM